MKNWERYIINSNANIKDALKQLDQLGLVNGVLFIADEKGCLLGSITDGDIRRGLLQDVNVNDPISKAGHYPCKFVFSFQPTSQELKAFRERNLRFIPVVNEEMSILGILDLEHLRRIIPVEAVLMAGGKGQRLLPLTEHTPKPLLKVGPKPIIEHNIDRLINHGVDNIYLSINYLGHKIRDYFGDGYAKGATINYIEEDFPMGTIGAARKVKSYSKKHLLIMNSDILTDIDFHEFYNDFVEQDADMSVAAISYHVDIPYAVMETDEHNRISSLKEKPRYTYYSNAGIYLMKSEMLEHVPHNEFFNVTDLIEELIGKGKKLITFPILGYWLDIGRMDDYKKAQEDIKHLNL
ncbi:nucleotidyltransferase family protein [Chitinophaga filiformis]|uniref:CBS domain-containing protein n=1 Tax=Chitinophaga filiformis TaxID=104663 RepID=A0A1G7UCR6_CHIFI|nr:nucleotidyltransferase family protein [Chitinophaga filiformis]SDG45382.1 CBS domain-containing protein [Chitinophaga filiformis]